MQIYPFYVYYIVYFCFFDEALTSGLLSKKNILLTCLCRIVTVYQA